MDRSERLEQEVLDVLFADPEADVEDKLLALRHAYCCVMSRTCAACRRHYAEFLQSQIPAMLQLADAAAEAHEVGFINEADNETEH
jgi:hypothetical protein